MRRSFVGVIMILLALVAPPARGQTPSDRWSPREARPVESTGEIVLTFTTSEPGRIVYYTSDGDCSRYPLDPPECGRPQAQAGKDYGAVKGEWIFGEAGSRTIRIPIHDDDSDEADHEAFAVNASRYDDVAEQTTWTNVIVRIADDDPRDDPRDPPATTAPPASTSPPATTAGDQSTNSSANSTNPASDDADAVVSGERPNAEVLASGVLPSGSGSKLMTEVATEPAPDRGGGGSMSWWLFLGLAGVGLSMGAVALARRRKDAYPP